MSDNLMTPEQAAEKLGVTANTLMVWRSTGRYELPFVKVGSSVMYRESDLNEWIDTRRVIPTDKGGQNENA